MSVEQKLRITKRQLLLGLGASAAALFGAACRPVESGPFEPEQVSDMRTDLTRDIRALPNSTVKSLLVANILPLFGAQPSEIVNYGGGIVRMINPTAQLVTSASNAAPKVDGTCVIKGANADNDTLFTLQDEKRVISLPHLLTPAEKNQRANDILPNGSFKTTVSFPKGDPVFEGISPEIKVYVPHPKLRKASIDALQTFFSVRASCSLLWDFMVMGLIDRNMQQARLSSSMLVVDKNNREKISFILSQAFYTLDSAGKRFHAFNELGPYVLALKALEGTPVYDTLKDDPNFAPMIATTNLLTLPVIPNSKLPMTGTL